MMTQVLSRVGLSRLVASCSYMTEYKNQKEGPLGLDNSERQSKNNVAQECRNQTQFQRKTGHSSQLYDPEF